MRSNFKMNSNTMLLMVVVLVVGGLVGYLLTNMVGKKESFTAMLGEINYRVIDDVPINNQTYSIKPTYTENVYGLPGEPLEEKPTYTENRFEIMDHETTGDHPKYAELIQRRPIYKLSGIDRKRELIP